MSTPQIPTIFVPFNQRGSQKRSFEAPQNKSIFSPKKIRLSYESDPQNTDSRIQDLQPILESKSQPSPKPDEQEEFDFRTYDLPPEMTQIPNTEGLDSVRWDLLEEFAVTWDNNNLESVPPKIDQAEAEPIIKPRRKHSERTSWKKAEEQTLSNLLNQGVSIRTIAESNLIPGRSEDSIGNKARKLGYHKRKIEPWKPEEKQTLSKLLNHGIGIQEIINSNLIPERTDAAIRARAKKEEKQAFSDSNQGLEMTSTKWKDEEKQALVEALNKKLTIETMVNFHLIPGRGKAAIKAMAQKLRSNKKKVGPRWKPEEKQELSNLLKQNKTIRDIFQSSVFPGRSISSIRSMAYALKDPESQS